MTLSRNEKILTHLSRDMKILEIGPSYGPIVRRSQGWNVFSLDHLDAEGLRKKYSYDPAVDPKAIEEVDFIWHNGSLDSAITDNHRGTFDGVIASHVIEHFPDLLGFFKAADRMLKPHGILSLVVPDKRFCFDYFQSVSLTGDVLDAHRKQRSRHSRKTGFNATAYTAKTGERISWAVGETPTLAFAFSDSLRGGHDHYTAQFDPAADPYLDFHGWYFTPSSFRLICLELAALGLMPFTEVGFFGTTGNEFFVTLQKTEEPDTANLEERRLGYLKSMLLEIREQTDSLIENGGDTRAAPHDCEGEARNAALQHAELQAQNAALRERVRELEAIERSTAWRATQMLRVAAAGLPEPVRRNLRRAAKAAYWAVTPHRMPARIRFLRNRGR